MRASACVAVLALSAAAANAEEIVVTMSGSSYAPGVISAAVGDTIRFVNDDATDHNVFVATAGFAMDLGKQEAGSEAMFVLRAPGRFEVECVFHAHMIIDVEVTG